MEYGWLTQHPWTSLMTFASKGRAGGGGGGRGEGGRGVASGTSHAAILTSVLIGICDGES
eukprot:3493232-Pleurochrysis_carterae.AAC.1